MQSPWIGRPFFTGSAIIIPMTSLHIGQRRINRFTVECTEPPLLIFDNKWKSTKNGSWDARKENVATGNPSGEDGLPVT